MTKRELAKINKLGDAISVRTAQLGPKSSNKEIGKVLDLTERLRQVLDQSIDTDTV